MFRLAITNTTGSLPLRNGTFDSAQTPPKVWTRASTDMVSASEATMRHVFARLLRLRQTSSSFGNSFRTHCSPEPLPRGTGTTRIR